MNITNSISNKRYMIFHSPDTMARKFKISRRTLDLKHKKKHLQTKNLLTKDRTGWTGYLRDT